MSSLSKTSTDQLGNMVCMTEEDIHRLNMKLDLQSSFGLHVTFCAPLFSSAETTRSPSPHLGLYTRGAIGQLR